MSALPTVTVVIPARDEASSISDCLAAVAAQDYPAELLEVLVVDGMSGDGTASEAAVAMARLGLQGRVLVNAAALTPSNLNAGLAEAGGEILCRVDARSLVPPNYVRRCVEILCSRPGVAVVGGAQVALAPHPGPTGRGIARALNNRWTMGLSRYRRGGRSGASDTVYLGAFRTDDLRRVGGWDVRLPTNQDFDLNRRLSSSGSVWFESSLEVGYQPRSSHRDLFRQYVRFGSWKVRYWRLTADRPRPRQVVLLAAPALLAPAGVVAVARNRSWGAPLALALAGLAVTLEARGAARPPARSPVDHLSALLAMGAVGGGWLAGAWSELVRTRLRPRRP